jgi:DNA-binding IclR family transcriptional regulator
MQLVVSRGRVLSAAQTRILAVLRPGGLLTQHQIWKAAGLNPWTSRRAMKRLAARGLIVTGAKKGRWQITREGTRLLGLAVGGPRGKPELSPETDVLRESS